MSIAENTLEFIIAVEDRATAIIQKMADALGNVADGHDDLTKSSDASGASITAVADAATGAAVAHDLHADAAAGSAESLDKIGESADAAKGKLAAFIAEVMGGASVNEVLRSIEGGLTGVSQAAKSIRAETLSAVATALEGMADKGARLESLELALEGVTNKNGALREAALALQDVAGSKQVLADLAPVLNKVNVEYENVSVATKVARAAGQEFGQSSREMSAELGVLGKVLEEFGLKGVIVAGVLGAITLAVGDGIKQFAEYQMMVERFQVNQQNSGRDMSFADLHDTSEQISQHSTYGADELDKAGAAVAQFTSLSSANIKMVMQDAADMAAGAGENIQGVAEKLGRVFNTPMNGLQILRRELGSISPELQKQMKEMDNAGDVQGERDLIDKKIKEMYGGQAQAMQETLGGAFQVLGTGLEEVFDNGIAAFGALVDAGGLFGNMLRNTGIELEDIASKLGMIKEFMVLHDGSDSSNLALARQNLAGDTAAASGPARGRFAAGVSQYNLNWDQQQIALYGGVPGDQSNYVNVGSGPGQTTLADADTITGKAMTTAESLIPNQKKIDDTNASIKDMNEAIKLQNSATEVGAQKISEFKEALGLLEGQLDSVGQAVNDLMVSLARSAAEAGTVGGDKGVMTFADKIAPQYIKDNPTQFENMSSSDALTKALSNPTVIADATKAQVDLAQAQLKATQDTFDLTKGYLEESHSTHKQIAEAATADIAATKAAMDAGDMTGVAIVNGRMTYTGKGSPSALNQVAISAGNESLSESAITDAAIQDNAPASPTEKKFQSLQDALSAAKAYDAELRNGNVTLAQAKEYQTAYTTAQQLSADGSIKLSAALKEVLGYTEQTAAATRDATNQENAIANSDAAAVNAATLAGGPQAGALLKAQRDAKNQGYTGAAATTFVNNALTGNMNTANDSVTSQINSLNEQIALQGAGQDPLDQANAKINFEAGPGGSLSAASPNEIAQLTTLTDQQMRQAEAIKQTQAAQASWNDIATKGFQSMDSALVNVIMRTQTWGQAFGDVAKQIANQIAQLALQQTLITPLENALGLGGGAGGGGGGLLGGLGGTLFGSIAGGLESGFGSGGGMSTSSLISHQGGSSSLLGSAGGFLSSFFADGGVSGPSGPMPLRMYSSGGIANSPQMSVFGEAGPEAYVPLADGRSIPVTVQGNGGTGTGTPMTNHFNVTVQTGNAPGGATPQQHAAMVGSEVSRQLEGMVVKIVQNQQRTGGILN